MENKISYRPDIDGLRAIAVLAVIAFHFFPGRVPGGFAGVDVFFVISGFLVTEIIYSDILKDQFSFASFYRRRARRLFPSLLLVLGFCFIAGWATLLASEFVLLAKHLVAGSLFSSNLLLFSEVSYFDQSADLKPLLHLWSLGIEEQFYLLWPVLIWATYKFGRAHVRKILVLVFLLSLASNLLLIKQNQSFTFYMLPTRLWELAFGGLIALGLREINSPVKRFPLVSSVLSALGAVLVLVSFFVLSKATQFPGAWALLPVVGTGLLLVAHKSTITNRTLAHPFLVFVGLISYPLYLWHWPLISFAKVILAEELRLGIKLFLFACSFLLAFLTYRLVENPIRIKAAANRLTTPDIK